MPFTLQELEDFLALYGAEIENWPEEVKNSVSYSENIKAADFLLLCEKYSKLEKTLRERRFVEESSFLAERIYKKVSGGL